MTRGVHKSLEFLTETANEAAVKVLLGGLDSADDEIQQGALLALLGRRRGAGQQELIRRWGRLSERSRAIIGDHPRQVSVAIRHAILSRDREHCSNGCDALLRIREYELIPTLVTAVEDPGNPQVALVAKTLVSLSELLYDEIAGPRTNQRRRDPQRLNRDVVTRLQQALDRYDRHRRPELMEAFLLLATQENTLLRGILAEPRHPTYLDLMEILRNSRRIGTIRLVLNFLPDRLAPSAALQVISHRTDTLFVRQLLMRVGGELTPEMKVNLRRMDSVAWLRNDTQLFDTLFDTLNDEEQRAAVELAVASGINRLEVFEVLKHILQTGKTKGRRAASAALSQFGGVDACQLTLAGLEDPDPQVQANMALQLRDRGVPGAIAKLITLLNSPAAVVQQAAQKCLTEFTFARFLSVFDVMDEGARQSTGTLVMQIDPTATTQLAAELKSRLRMRRLRALEVAISMDAVGDVEPLVIGSLEDEDLFVRAEAARALAYCNSRLAKESLRNALMDRSATVRDAAEFSLERIAEVGRRTAPSTLTSAIRHVETSPPIDGPAVASTPLPKF